MNSLPSFERKKKRGGEGVVSNERTSFARRICHSCLCVLFTGSLGKLEKISWSCVLSVDVLPMTLSWS